MSSKMVVMITFDSSDFIAGFRELGFSKSYIYGSFFFSVEI